MHSDVIQRVFRRLTPHAVICLAMIAARIAQAADFNVAETRKGVVFIRTQAPDFRPSREAVSSSARTD